ncbi:tRNA(Ile)-lysidine synthase [Desulfitispora alkaliphila]|uniref:tRNA lysidine(34) synthetase TilS n=1 Tax=Desulfitispora alkaliphila TaxID=622674 RepID=UPI003D221C33
MLKKFIATINKHWLIRKGDTVLLGVSGGADSVAMLFAFCQLREQYHLNLHVAHLNHGFRGKESREDAEFVKTLCKNLNVSCTVEEVDMPSILKATGTSSQEGSRKERYSFFSRVAKEIAAEKIAIAQNKDDQAETVLINMLRGGGLAGLKGIPIKRGKIIRPLLGVTRAEIEAYCKENKLSYRTDSSNLKKVYLRNQIRLDLLPQLKREYNPRINEVLAQTAQIFAAEEEYLSLEAQQYYSKLCIAFDAGLQLDIDKFLGTPLAIKRRVVTLAWKKLLPADKQYVGGLEFEHVERIIELIETGAVGKLLELPQEVVVKRGYDKVIFHKHRKLTSYSKQAKVVNKPIIIPGTTEVKELNCRVITEVCKREDLANVKQDAKKVIAKFDYDLLDNEDLYLRNRKPGDRFQPKGFKGTKKLKDFFIDQKVAREKREHIPIVATAKGDIVWVVGYRMSDHYKITAKTHKILLVKIELFENE